MAAGIPQEKAVEFLKLFGEMLKTGDSISDEVSYRRFLRDLETINSPASVSAIGLLHAVAGHLDKANQAFESGMKDFDDISIPSNHLFMLKVTRQESLIKDVSYTYADNYVSKDMTRMAYSYAYRFGDRDGLVKYIDQHIKLLSDEEGRQLAEKHKEELLSELDDAYETSGCTQEQFELLALIISTVAKEYGADFGLIEASRNHNCSYVADIKNKDPKTIAEMNYSLAEAICMEPRLDNCNLVGRFSPERDLHTGISYVRSQ